MRGKDHRVLPWPFSSKDLLTSAHLSLLVFERQVALLSQPSPGLLLWLLSSLCCSTWWGGHPASWSPRIQALLGAGSLSFNAIDILGHTTVVRVFNTIPGVGPLDAHGKPPSPSCDNKKCLHTLTNVPGVGLGENHPQLRIAGLGDM